MALARSRTAKARRGGAVLEAVLVLSLLLSLALGAAEYGYALFLKHSLMAATTVGLRTAILSGSTNAAVQTAVASQMAMNGLQSTPYTLTTIPTSVNSCVAGTYVTVTVSCTWGSTGINTLPVSMGGFPSSKIFAASATMVHE
jgi:Flp pilus assembly protein TadG